MILKIERRNKMCEWFWMDNIKKITMSNLMNKEKAKDVVHETVVDEVEASGFCPDSYIFDFEGKSTFCVLRCRIGDSNYVIAFDTVAYILNDNGRTIDTIICNG